MVLEFPDWRLTEATRQEAIKDNYGSISEWVPKNNYLNVTYLSIKTFP